MIVAAQTDAPHLMRLRKQVLEYSLKMAHSGLAPATWGNISVRDPETGLILITPSGMAYDKLQPDDICVLDLHGTPVDCRRKPSTETPLHLVFYRAKPRCHAVVHTHSLYATAFAALGQEIPVVVATLASAVGGAVPCAPYVPAGTEDLGRAALEAMRDRNAVLLGNHGVVAIGSSLEEAYTVAEVVENTAKIYHLALTVGRPRILPEPEVTRIREEYLTRYGQK